MFSLKEYGNTSSSSIPLTLCANLDKFKNNTGSTIAGTGTTEHYKGVITDFNSSFYTNSTFIPKLESGIYRVNANTVDNTGILAFLNSFVNRIFVFFSICRPICRPNCQPTT